MSLFRRPKKAAIKHRMFRAADDDENTEHSENENANGKNGEDTVLMDAEDSRMKTPPPPCISISRKHGKKTKEDIKKSTKKSSLLSFGDEGTQNKIELLCFP